MGQRLLALSKGGAEGGTRARRPSAKRDGDARQDEKEVIAEFERYLSVHKVIRYRDTRHIEKILDGQVVTPATPARP
jgi:hypothetical protein